jgi:hypothetical protein
MKLHTKPWVKITLISVLSVILLFGGFVFAHNGIGADLTNPPKFIQADFIDLSKIYSISKFRSGIGHDFSGNGETCRSMKHYFSPQFDPNDVTGGKDANGIPPKPDGKTDIDIFSPVDGTVVSVSEERTPIGKQITIVPDSAKAYSVRLFHVWPSIELKGGILGVGGTHLTAGQKIGVIGAKQATDIAIQAGGISMREAFMSYFDVMPDSVFAAYQKRGAKTRDDFIFTKEYRDAHPYGCNQDKSSGQEFTRPEGWDENTDIFPLSGYVAVDKYQGNGTQQNGPGSKKK